jgi:predicted ATP-dependent serine protease
MSPFERRGDRIRATRQQFLWHRRIPLGHITALGGGPSKGKSTLGYLAAKEADVPTIFVTSEEVDETVWKPRIVAAGLDLKKAFHHREVKFSRNPKDIGYLRGLIETYDAKLVVVDPLTNHLRDASISHD